MRLSLVLPLLWLGFLASFALSRGVDPLVQSWTSMLVGPNPEFWLGTDSLGRDVLARLAASLVVALQVASGVLLLTALIGIPLGLMAARCGGWIEQGITRVSDAFLAIPGFLLAVLVTALLGPGLLNVIGALAVGGWITFYRLTRVEALKLQQQEFVQAATLLGRPDWYVWSRHILPNAAPILLVEALFVAAGAILAEAGLSFLGVGLPLPHPSLGQMLREGSQYLLVAPHLVIFPAMTLMCALLVLSQLGEWARKKLAVGERT